MAPPSIKPIEINAPLSKPFFVIVYKYLIPRVTITILKMVRKYLPALPPNSKPKAIPLFSAKWIINQSYIMNS